MPRFRLPPAFQAQLRKFTRRNATRKQAVSEALRTFQVDPQHPSLHLEKIAGTDIWTIRIDQGNRLFFIWSDAGDTAIFFSVGSHDSYRRLG